VTRGKCSHVLRRIATFKTHRGRQRLHRTTGHVRPGSFMTALRLPDPMLSRAGPLPIGDEWSFEPKWDGFRAIVSTQNELRIRSRRGWNMTAILPELRGLPAGLVLDGELVAWRKDEPYFPYICRRVLNRDMSIPTTFVIFDLLWEKGVELIGRPYSERKRKLERLALDAQPGLRQKPSMTGMPSSPRSASSASRGSLRRTTRASTARTIAAG
jgi:ATP-dependent DNA ligase